ncbi:4-(cytidine 5'-diphospho)-2-C-methyl-D-erythritol kinase [Tumidithrix elongata RA019]|uniref:4-diphosphocytidyl-2-C-methyl-D-erythritol kinase n=1 Tax=Tumidithrix elongata BACA0141 TaxID=2716417 RepID=A0AAW9PRH0_9CYAN|nr:4-(cytidine 5'-diphospho)-2-C-methyl-D-erythritol kinase [Tumidithrix elongata RA019]
MTSSISLKSAAKINLYLEITGNRPDGYHELVMVLQTIDLCDRLDLRTISSDAIHISCDNDRVPTDETNLAFKAARLMQQNYPGLGGVEIAIAKQVPMGAGLAGGSGNAAAVLVGLDRLWDLGLTQSELCDLAAQLGSDIPFCVAGGTALAIGRGEVLSPLPDLQNLALAICKPRDLSISTVWAYQTFRSQGLLATSPVREQHNSSQMLAAIAARDETTPTRVGRLLYNDLERVVLPAHPRIATLKAFLQQQECLGVLMSGSGSTVFAIAQDLGQAERIAASLQADADNSDLDIWVTTSLIGGVLDV